MVFLNCYYGIVKIYVLKLKIINSDSIQKSKYNVEWKEIELKSKLGAGAFGEVW